MESRYSREDFRHQFDYRVRSHECDRQGVVHNAKYLELLEIARIEYCRDAMDIPMDAGTFAAHHKFFFVRNAMDYYSPARFDDELRVWTRVSRMGTTSVAFEQIVEQKGSGVRVLEAEAVMVYVDEATDRPKELLPEFRERVARWEGYSAQ